MVQGAHTEREGFSQGEILGLLCFQSSSLSDSITMLLWISVFYRSVQFIKKRKQTEKFAGTPVCERERELCRGGKALGNRSNDPKIVYFSPAVPTFWFVVGSALKRVGG